MINTNCFIDSPAVTEGCKARLCAAMRRQMYPISSDQRGLRIRYKRQTIPCDGYNCDRGWFADLLNGAPGLGRPDLDLHQRHVAAAQFIAGIPTWLGQQFDDLTHMPG